MICTSEGCAVNPCASPSCDARVPEKAISFARIRTGAAIVCRLSNGMTGGSASFIRLVFMANENGLVRSLSGILRTGLRRNIALSLSQALVGMAATLATYRILVTETDVETLGLWSLTVGVVAFARIADISGGNGLNRLVAIATLHGRDASSLIDSVTLFSIALYGGLSLALAVPLQHLLALNVPVHHHATSDVLVLWALGTLVTTVLSAVHLNALDGVHRADIRSSLQIAGAAVLLGSGALLIPEYGAVGLAAAQILHLGLVTLGARAVLTRLVPRLGFLPFRFEWAALREAFGYGLRLQITGIAQLLGDSGARLVVNQYAGLTGLAAYDVAQRLCSYANVLVVSAMRPLVPEFSRSHELDRARRDALYARTVRMTALAGGLIFSGLGAIGPLVGLFILGGISDVYLANLAWLSLGWCITALSVPGLMLARGAGGLRWNIIGQWSGAVGILVLGALAGATGDERLISLGIAIGLSAGAYLQVVGNSRYYGLALPSALVDWRGNCALALLVAAVSTLLAFAFLG